jgi:hypothetical protein
MKYVAPEISPTPSTWPVQPIYPKKNCSRDFRYCFHMVCKDYIRDKKICSHQAAIEVNPRWSFLTMKPSLRLVAYKLVSSARSVK